MYIESLEIKGLFGHFNKKMKFKHECALLVGINGSGKTTILNIINWLLRPSIPELSSTRFDSIKMLFFVESTKYLINCWQEKGFLKYELTVDGHTPAPLIVPLAADLSDLSSDYRRMESIRRSYENLHPDEKEMEVWKLLEAIPNPVFLSIERNPSQLILPDYDERRIVKKMDRVSPLDYASMLIRNAYSQSNANVLKLTEKFKTKLMLYAFDSLYDVDYVTSHKKSSLPTISQIEKVESRVLTLCVSEQIPHDDVEKVRLYFEKLKKIGNPLRKEKTEPVERLNYVLNITQFDKVKSILNDFEDFEKKKRDETNKVEKFIQIMNDFYEDSNKILYFNPATSSLAYLIKNKRGEPVESEVDIHYLSSGEKQLLVLFANIIFGEPGHVYIIDEPELSLHVKWLEMLYSHIESVSPAENQLIIATHSPILADKKRDNAVILYPY